MILKALMDRFRGKDSEAEEEKAPATAPKAAPRPPASRRPSDASPSPAPATAPVPVTRSARPPRPAGQAANPREVSPETIKYILNMQGGQLLTAPGGIAELTPQQAQYVALLSDAENRTILLVSRDFALHHETSSARSAFRRKGISWSKEYHVELEVIRSLNEKYGAAAGTSASGGHAALAPAGGVTMQREFLSLISRAAELGSSDIHIIVKRYEAQVRIRTDGVMMKFQELTSGQALELCQAAFAMADASDTMYMPLEYQGARVTESSLRGARFPEGVQSVRLQFNPLPAGGRYMIARLLYAQKVGSNEDVDSLGYAPNQIAQIRYMRRKPYGINIISGPTGSGKSTTLQRGLTALMRERPGVNVVTIEDPPEYVIEGAAQLPVTNAKTADERSEKFRQAITAALRSDPDVIMIGEIRDGASAQLAFEAAMTGHGVWASLHANDAVSILDRLRDQHVELYKLCDASLVTGLIGQRLVRRNRADNSVGMDEAIRLGFIDPETADHLRRLAGDRAGNIRFAPTHLFEGIEQKKAYAGRAVVAETLAPDQKFLDLIKAERKPEAVQHWLDHLEGMTMLEHAFYLVCCGTLDPRELEDKVGFIRDVNPDRVERIFALAEGR